MDDGAKSPSFRELNRDVIGIGGVKHDRVKWPKRYPALQRGEVTFTGAGIVPLCIQDDVSYALVQKRLRGSKNPVLFYDFGGKKKPGKKENGSVPALPLMMKTCEDWAMRQVIHGDKVFMQSE